MWPIKQSFLTCTFFFFFLNRVIHPVFDANQDQSLRGQWCPKKDNHSWLKYIKKEKKREKERKNQPYFLILHFHFNHCISTVYALTFFNIACSVKSTNIESTCQLCNNSNNNNSNIHNSYNMFHLKGLQYGFFLGWGNKKYEVLMITIVWI